MSCPGACSSCPAYSRDMTTPIVELDRLEGPLRSGFKVVVVKVPPGLPLDHRCRELYDDRSVRVPCEAGTIWCTVQAPDGADGVACATFAADSESVRCDTIDVTPEYRRKGIANALYDLASSVFGAAVIPSDLLTDDGRRFWGTRTKIPQD